MSTVAQQISNLLFSHECVIIPGLGAFVSTTISAQFDADRNVFLPPSKEIGFNRSLSHNDGLLISTLAQKNAISYGKAKVMVEEFVAQIMAKAQQGEKVVIEKVGTLKQDALGYLQFSYENSESYLTDSFGLSSFHFTPAVKPKPVVENKDVRRLLRPVGLKRIAASVAIVVGLFAVSQRVDNPTLNRDVNSAGAFSFVYSNESKAEVEETISIAPEEVEDVAVEVEPVEKDSYFLIAGSFKTQTQADQFLQKIKKQGEEQAFVLASPNNRFRVAIEGFVSKEDAVDELRLYRKQEAYKTVWVLTQH